MPIISGGSMVALASCWPACVFERSRRGAFSFAITSSLSAICFTCFGETKLIASTCLNPASTSSLRYSALYSVGISSGNPCQASRGHSISVTSLVILFSTFLEQYHEWERKESEVRTED